MEKATLLEMGSERINCIERLPIERWHGPFPLDIQEHALSALEAGKVIVLENLPFTLNHDELKFLDPMICGNARKNISFDFKTRKISNVASDERDRVWLAVMMDRFGNNASHLLRKLLGSYAASLERGHTSYRPAEIRGRSYSPRHDDRRLHMDAFPSQPMHGGRILRVFTNIADDGTARHWQVGEPFEDFVKKFMPRLRAPWPGSAWLIDRMGITRGKRSLYDYYMLQMHDKAKLDNSYQAKAPKTDIYFKPGTTWVCFTDQVLHAAISGHAALEQTFYLPVNAMANPLMAPLNVLERLTGYAMV